MTAVAPLQRFAHPAAGETPDARRLANAQRLAEKTALPPQYPMPNS
ncbi:hypothetical protein [Nostoc sp.]